MARFVMPKVWANEQGWGPTADNEPEQFKVLCGFTPLWESQGLFNSTWGNTDPFGAASAAGPALLPVQQIRPSGQGGGAVAVQPLSPPGWVDMTPRVCSVYPVLHSRYLPVGWRVSVGVQADQRRRAQDEGKMMTNESLRYEYNRAEDKSFRIVDNSQGKRKGESMLPL